jgi:hypothetical protein
MKKLFLLLFAVASTISCEKENISTNQESTSISDSESKVASNPTFTYTESTRGQQTKITVNDKLLFEEKTGIETSSTIGLVSNSAWKNFIKIYKATDIKNIATFEAPSDLRASDRVPSASISIEVNGITYTSNEFDAGNPPAEISKLVNALTKFTVFL